MRLITAWAARVLTGLILKPDTPGPQRPTTTANHFPRGNSAEWLFTTADFETHKHVLPLKPFFNSTNAIAALK